jgi:hypothetical protein
MGQADGRLYLIVIPGRCEASNPESRSDNFWIPGLRLTAHPGMT